jgi:NAD(P)H-nitrite reductase large subunit
MKIVIIGNHAAGLSSAETLRRLDRSAKITVISKEDTPPYSRCLVGDIIASKKSIKDILFRGRDFYKKNNIQTILGQEAVSLDIKNNKVILAGGKKCPYDYLILAGGADPVLPNIPGAGLVGVFGLRTIGDAQKIKKFAGTIEKAVVLGGGLVGIKSALALSEAGKKVTVLVRSESILSQIIGGEEAVIIKEYLEGRGIEFIKHASAKEILGQTRVEAVLTEDGTRLECGLVISAKGVSPNIKLVRNTKIKTDYGIVVDDRCRTNIKNIYAAGDIAQSRDNVRGEKWMNSIWPLAVEEGRVAAENIMGRKSVLRERTSMNALVFGDLQLISCGLSGAREVSKDTEKIIVERQDENGQRNFRKFIFRDERLVAFSVMGDIANAGILNLLVRKGINCTGIKKQILSGRYEFADVLPCLIKQKEKFDEPEFTGIFESVKNV